MKKVIFIGIMSVIGLTVSLQAQSSCEPCPPGCCWIKCCTEACQPGQAASADAAVQKAITVSMADWKSLASQCEGMTKKEIKDCLKSCQSMVSSCAAGSAKPICTTAQSACQGKPATEKLPAGETIDRKYHHYSAMITP